MVATIAAKDARTMAVQDAEPSELPCNCTHAVSTGACLGVHRIDGPSFLRRLPLRINSAVSAHQPSFPVSSAAQTLLAVSIPMPEVSLPHQPFG